LKDLISGNKETYSKLAWRAAAVADACITFYANHIHGKFMACYLYNS